jgi:hypothetical protein
MKKTFEMETVRYKVKYTTPSSWNCEYKCVRDFWTDSKETLEESLKKLEEEYGEDLLKVEIRKTVEVIETYEREK